MKYPLIAVAAIASLTSSQAQAQVGELWWGPVLFAVTQAPRAAATMNRAAQNPGFPRTVTNGLSGITRLRNSNRIEYVAPRQQQCGYVTTYYLGRTTYRQICR
jgi:hypothetical protein